MCIVIAFYVFIGVLWPTMYFAHCKLTRTHMQNTFDNSIVLYLCVCLFLSRLFIRLYGRVFMSVESSVFPPI